MRPEFRIDAWIPWFQNGVEPEDRGGGEGFGSQGPGSSYLHPSCFWAAGWGV